MATLLKRGMKNQTQRLPAGPPGVKDTRKHLSSGTNSISVKITLFGSQTIKQVNCRDDPLIITVLCKRFFFFSSSHDRNTSCWWNRDSYHGRLRQADEYQYAICVLNDETRSTSYFREKRQYCEYFFSHWIEIGEYTS